MKVWYACDSLAEDCLASPKLLGTAQTSHSPLGKVSPNPASDLLQIVAPAGAATGLVQVRDLNGVLLETRNWHKASEVFVLKTAGWKAGIYSVSFQTGNGTSTARVVISN